MIIQVSNKETGSPAMPFEALGRQYRKSSLQRNENTTKLTLAVKFIIVELVVIRVFRY